MNKVYYDSGTTNTRAYLFQNEALLSSLSQPIGSKDVALAGNNHSLLTALSDMLVNLCQNCNISEDSIDQVWMSGMISSPTGIVEVPHLTVPVDRIILSKHVKVFYEPFFFKRNLYIIPGVKTHCNDVVSLENIHTLNNMRGEETEIFGILQLRPDLSDNCIMIMPGSHTQIAFIKNGAIVNIISTISGELYNAIKSGTIISTSISSCQNCIVDESMLCKGYENLKTYGFNRALYTVRTLELFMDTTADQRYSYFEGILNGGILNVIQQVTNPADYTKVVVYGSEESIKIFQTLFAGYLPQYRYEGISSRQEIPYSAKGFLSISSCKNLPCEL